MASRELASGEEDKVGPNAGLYSMASGAEVLAHFDQLMQQRRKAARWREGLNLPTSARDGKAELTGAATSVFPMSVRFRPSDRRLAPNADGHLQSSSAA